MPYRIPKSVPVAKHQLSKEFPADTGIETLTLDNGTPTDYTSYSARFTLTGVGTTNDLRCLTSYVLVLYYKMG